MGSFDVSYYENLNDADNFAQNIFNALCNSVREAAMTGGQRVDPVFVVTTALLAGTGCFRTGMTGGCGTTLIGKDVCRKVPI